MGKIGQTWVRSRTDAPLLAWLHQHTEDAALSDHRTTADDDIDITPADIGDGVVFITTEQLARRWQTTPKSISNRRADGRLKLRAHRLGTALRFKLSDVEAFEAASVIDFDGDCDD